MASNYMEILRAGIVSNWDCMSEGLTVLEFSLAHVWSFGLLSFLHFCVFIVKGYGNNGDTNTNIC